MAAFLAGPRGRIGGPGRSCGRLGSGSDILVLFMRAGCMRRQIHLQRKEAASSSVPNNTFNNCGWLRNPFHATWKPGLKPLLVGIYWGNLGNHHSRVSLVVRNGFRNHPQGPKREAWEMEKNTCGPLALKTWSHTICEGMEQLGVPVFGGALQEKGWNNLILFWWTHPENSPVEPNTKAL